eukprot:CAMPEP_0179975692 /NCGR_PEP_ID=MMETSP0983-20121128/38855_1 /TAXON_ID=483367 /ORGANISM="non described non described, Strain CCMP 2436" /LENGTH=154 /DNA_ID=CAMNT_0021892217 /DNA_START=1 /DNA_END=462 /DNA_ORIENTATION=-
MQGIHARRHAAVPVRLPRQQAAVPVRLPRLWVSRLQAQRPRHSHAGAQRRAAVPVRLPGLWVSRHAAGPPQDAQAHAQRRAAVPVRRARVLVPGRYIEQPLCAHAHATQGRTRRDALVRLLTSPGSGTAQLLQATLRSTSARTAASGHSIATSR